MKNLTPELIAKAKAAKSAEELFELAKENNVELTEEEAKTYFEQLNANGAVSDDELGAVAGGFLGISCPDNDGEETDVLMYREGKVTGSENEVEFKSADSVFVPANAGKVTVEGKCSFIVTTV